MYSTSRLLQLRSMVSMGHSCRATLTCPSPSRRKYRFVVSSCPTSTTPCPVLLGVISQLETLASTACTWEHWHMHTTGVQILDFYVKVDVQTPQVASANHDVHCGPAPMTAFADDALQFAGAGHDVQEVPAPDDDDELQIDSAETIECRASWVSLPPLLPMSEWSRMYAPFHHRSDIDACMVKIADIVAVTHKKVFGSQMEPHLSHSGLVDGFTSLLMGTELVTRPLNDLRQIGADHVLARYIQLSILMLASAARRS
eukprot:TRINITY_DN37188_c0_g1_i1.p1 TRINITY_DN37188_c0_g1~~TRINITY_DN37188_c0_g1_i1.p1  ORF type:complete len:257 (-),score=13.11 TRINITY_DN37188_c0_g1_i1:97-867(-)